MNYIYIDILSMDKNFDVDLSIFSNTTKLTICYLDELNVYGDISSL